MAFQGEQQASGPVIEVVGATRNVDKDMWLGRIWRSVRAILSAASRLTPLRPLPAERTTRAIVLQQETQRPVQIEITPATREAVEAWIKLAALRANDYLFPSRLQASPHLGTRQYARIVDVWVKGSA